LWIIQLCPPKVLNSLYAGWPNGERAMSSADLFAFSARLEIYGDARIVDRAKAQIADESGIP
jgi:hypothetical protein